MAILGITYRVAYVAKNLTSGLTDIYARVMKPDGSVAGNFPLTELSGSFFAGVYYFDLDTSVSDPNGNWIAVIYSPTELQRDAKIIEYIDLLTTNKFLGLK